MVGVIIGMSVLGEADKVALSQQLHEIKVQVGLYSEIEVTFSVGNGGEQ